MGQRDLRIQLEVISYNTPITYHLKVSQKNIIFKILICSALLK